MISASRNAHSICVYINGLLTFSEMGSKSKYSQSSCKNLTFISQANIYFAYIFHASIIAFPIAYLYGVHMMFPCNPSLVGYFLNPVCWNDTPGFLQAFSVFQLVTYSLKFIILLINHWIWSFGAQITALVITVILIICPISFGIALKR